MSNLESLTHFVRYYFIQSNWLIDVLLHLPLLAPHGALWLLGVNLLDRRRY